MIQKRNFGYMWRFKLSSNFLQRSRVPRGSRVLSPFEVSLIHALAFLAEGALKVTVEAVGLLQREEARNPGRHSRNAMTPLILRHLKIEN